MGQVSPRTIADRVGAYSDGIVSDLLTNLRLEPSNYILNWRFDDLNDDGDPDNFGDGIALPETPEGFRVFMTEPGGGRNSLADQFTSAIDVDEVYVDLDSPFVPGASPVSSQFALQIASPDFQASYLEALTSTTTGFEAGTYQIAFTWIRKVKKRYLHTRMSPALAVSVGQSQWILLVLPDSPAEEVTHIGVWLSEPNGTTMRLQRIISANEAGSEYTLKGPYITRSATPVTNEHAYQPKAPSVRKAPGDFDGEPGRYRAAVRRIELATGKESDQSEWSNWIELTSLDIARGEAIEVDPEGLNFTSNAGSEYQYILYIQKSPADDVAAIEDFVYVNPDGVGGTSILRFTPSLSPIQGGRDSGGRRPRHSGRKHRKRKGKGGKSARTGGLRSKRKKRGKGAAGATGAAGGGSSSTLGDTVIEDPSSTLESAVGVGKTLIAPGTYKVALAFEVEEDQTTPSLEYSITITSGQIIRVWLPPSINRVFNAQWRTKTATGTLPGWTLTGAGATANEGDWDVDPATGDLTLDTNGLKNSFPTQSTPELSQVVSINQANRWTFGGELSVFLAAGTVEFFAEERDQSAAVLRTNIIKSITASTDSEFSLTIGPNYLAWASGTSTVRFGIRFTGASRNGSVTIKELYAIPWERRLRRRSCPKNWSRKHCNSRPPTYVSWEKAATYGVELPPVAFRVPPDFVPLQRMDFETGSLPAGWSQRTPQGTGGMTIGVNGTAALTGSYGWQSNRTVAANRDNYLEYYYGVMNATTLRQRAWRFTVKLTTQNPSYAYTYLAGLKSNSNTTGEATMLCGILNYYGTIYLSTRDNSSGDTDWYQIATGVKTGDTLDIELFFRGGERTDQRAEYRLAVGKNGAARAFTNWIQDFTASDRDVYFYMGPFASYDTRDNYNLYYDNLIVTEFGDIESGAVLTAATDPIPLPDRPYRDPIYNHTQTFESGTTPSTVAISGSGKTAAVNGAAALFGSYGLRVQDTGTAGYGYYYYEETVTRAKGGWGAHYQVDALPSNGTFRILQVANSALGTMAAYDLGSNGELRAIVATPAGEQTATVVRTGVVAGNRLTLEINFSGVGSAAGAVDFWHTLGAETAAFKTERQLYKQYTGLDWSTYAVAQYRAGNISKTDPAATINLKVDNVFLTAEGEIVFSEFDSKGNNIYQVNYWLPEGSPLRDDLMVQNLRLAVKPESTYTLALKVRISSVALPAKPLSVTCYDTSGGDHDMGDIFDGVGGCVGTLPWADQYLTFTTPADCYELSIDSRDMGEGEWTFQEPYFGPGLYADVQREVEYPVEGTHRLILNTETEGELLWLQPPVDRPWLAVGVIGTVPEGCNMTSEIATRDDLLTPDESEWMSPFDSAVKRKKYAHWRIKMYSNEARDLTPELTAQTPWIDFISKLGNEPVPTLLRGDFSEFYGGVYVQDLNWAQREWREYDIKKPQGRLIRHALTEPIGRFEDGFKLVAFTQRAMEEIEANCLSEEFVLEYLGERLTIKFSEPILFSVEAPTRRWVGDEWFARGDASSGGEVEIVSFDPMPGWQDA